jgi:Reverse transcriptase (RNA-dependent DNA polymerase)
VIQGCPLSPTLFGIFIDKLHTILEDYGGAGTQLGRLILQLLIFADDVVLLAHDQEALQKHLDALEMFCQGTGMTVNLKKTKCLGIGTRQNLLLCFQGKPVEFVKTYKYLGVEFSQNLSWASCVKSRVANGYKAFYAFVNKCKEAGLYTWKLRKHLFGALVKPVILYGAQVWGAGVSKSGWQEIEKIQKLFLEMELGVRSQTPYALTLAEAGLLPLEAEALFQALKYILRVRELEGDRLPFQALRSSAAKGWYADVCIWAQAWDFPEHQWPTDPKKLRLALEQKVVHKCWQEPSPRLQYYMRDVNPMCSYGEQEYLSRDISVQLRHIIACYRLSSHHLEVEQGRWKGIERKNRVCRLCDNSSIENEYHVFIACKFYEGVRVASQILVKDLYALFNLAPQQLGRFILAIHRYRLDGLRHLEVSLGP